MEEKIIQYLIMSVLDENLKQSFIEFLKKESSMIKMINNSLLKIR